MPVAAAAAPRAGTPGELAAACTESQALGGGGAPVGVVAGAAGSAVAGSAAGAPRARRQRSGGRPHAAGRAPRQIGRRRLRGRGRIQ